MKLAVIPARGGSKRIPRKNIKFFGGLPMIAWSIRAAHDSGCFDRIVVSTDDDEIAAISREYGAEIPFTRPRELADDHAGTAPVVAHAVQWQNQNGTSVSEACCIYATAPFVRPSDLHRGLAALEAVNINYAFSVTSFAFPIARAVRITPFGRVEMFNPEHFNTRSQDLEDAYHDAGQFYWGRADAWLKGLPLFGPASAPVLIPRHLVQDIDTEEDWINAEWMLKALRTQQSHTGDR